MSILSCVDNTDGTYSITFDAAINVTSTAGFEPTWIVLFVGLQTWYGLYFQHLGNSATQVVRPTNPVVGCIELAILGQNTSVTAPHPFNTAQGPIPIT